LEERLKKGEVLRKLFIQPAHEPLSWQEQVILFYAFQRNILVMLPPKGLELFQQGIFKYLCENYSALINEITQEEMLTKNIKSQLDEKFLEKVESEFKDKVVVAIDAREGIVHTKGWVFKTKVSAIDLAKKIEVLGIKRINYTDISRDGTLEGPNLKSLQRLLKSTKIDIVASGGISTIDDIKNLKTLEKDGLVGVIIGKALYENTINLTEAIRVCSNDTQGVRV